MNKEKHHYIVRNNKYMRFIRKNVDLYKERKGRNSRLRSIYNAYTRSYGYVEGMKKYYSYYAKVSDVFCYFMPWEEVESV